MAGDWIKMRTNLDTDPAVVRIASGLNADRFAVVGRLHRIWSWANEHLTDGQDAPIDSAFLDSLVETPGFAEQLRRVGWLSGRDGSLCFPQFERHNGHSAKQRALDSSRKKRVRKMSGSQPDKMRTREEKRRVELIEKKSTKRKRSSFRPPTVEEIAAYVGELGGTLDARAFHDYYASNGWKVGRNPMRDWKAAVRQWLSREQSRAGPGAVPVVNVSQLPSEHRREIANASVFDRIRRRADATNAAGGGEGCPRIAAEP